MADRMRDAEDRALDALFRTEMLADNGFSERVVRRIRQQIWIRRLTLPTALVIGLIFSTGPLLELLELGRRLVGLLPMDWTSVPAQSVPQLPLILLGTVLFVIGWLSIRMLEE